MVKKALMNIIFSFTYITLIIPVGLILKFIGKDFLERKKHSKSKSYWNK